MGRKNYQALILTLLWLCAGAVSCKKDAPSDPVKPAPQGSGNVYVVCEGSLGNGNSSLSLYRPSSDSVFLDVYKAMNGNSLGDVFQSMQSIDDKLFLCINNSDKIVVLDKTTWKEAGTINVPKPRYILPVDANHAFVSSLFNSKVYLIDPQAMQLQRDYDVPFANAEGMALYDNRVLLCLWDTANRQLYDYHASDFSLKTTYQLPGSAPQEVVADKENRYWVLSGNVQKGKQAYLTCIDPATGTTVKTFAFPAGADPIKPVFNNTRDTLYFIEVNYSGGTDHNGIYRMAITDMALPSQPFIAAGKFQYFWALGIEPGTGNLYVGDPKGFIQKGTVYVYRPDGTNIKQFDVGVGPGHFYFD